MSNKLEDLDKSLELAERINEIKIPLLLVDLDYAKEVAARMQNHGNFMDSAAALNPMYNPTKSDVYRLQGKSLCLLVEFIETLKEVDKLKAEALRHEMNQEKIMNLFR
jgi:hypothetical protein